MINIILIAERQLGVELIRAVSSKSQFKILGVLTTITQKEQQWWPGPSPMEFCKENNIPSYDINSTEINMGFKIKFTKPHYSVAVLNTQLRSEEYINWAGKAINIHGAPLPNYQGNNCTHFAILNGEKRFGMTAYLTTSKKDEGPIVARTEFDIPENYTNKDLYDLNLESGKELIDKLINQILNDSVRVIEEFDLEKAVVYDGMGSREINTDWSDEKIERTIRAFHFPPFEPAYIINKGQKFYLIPDKNEKK